MDQLGKQDIMLEELFNCIKIGDVNRCRDLIDRGVNINVVHDRRAALHMAIVYEEMTCVKLLIENGADVNLNTDNKEPPLHAALQCDISYAKLLLEHGADVNIASKTYGFTALHYASSSGNKNMVQLLLEYGADTSIMDDIGFTAEKYAIQYGKKDIVDMLRCGNFKNIKRAI